MAANAIGDTFNLLQPDSKLGYVCERRRLADLAVDAGDRDLGRSRTHAWVQPANAYNASSASVPPGSRSRPSGRSPSMFILSAPASGTWTTPRWRFATATLFVAGVRLTLTVREAQALNSARFRSLIDNAWDLIVVAEADFEVAYITPSSERVLGYPPHDLEGSP